MSYFVQSPVDCRAFCSFPDDCANRIADQEVFFV